jgi:hypothetical protein
VAIGLPAPVAIGKVRDLFVGFIPAPAPAFWGIEKTGR